MIFVFLLESLDIIDSSSRRLVLMMMEIRLLQPQRVFPISSNTTKWIKRSQPEPSWDGERTSYDVVPFYNLNVIYLNFIIIFFLIKDGGAESINLRYGLMNIEETPSCGNYGELDYNVGNMICTSTTAPTDTDPG